MCGYIRRTYNVDAQRRSARGGPIQPNLPTNYDPRAYPDNRVVMRYELRNTRLVRRRWIRALLDPELVERPALRGLLRSRVLSRPSTSVENPLQISSFLTNKANFPDVQMNVNKVLTRDYENIANSKLCENKPNTKPNKANQTQFHSAPEKCPTGSYCWFLLHLIRVPDRRRDMLRRMSLCCPVVDRYELSIRSLDKPRITEISVVEPVNLEIISENYLRSPCGAFIAAEPGNHLLSGAVAVHAA